MFSKSTKNKDPSEDKVRLISDSSEIGSWLEPSRNVAERRRGKRTTRRTSVRCISLLCCPIPARYIFCIVSFFGLVMLYALRVNLSVAIVAMVNVTSFKEPLNSTDCTPTAPQFSWTGEEQGWILSAFFYGYILTQLPGGYLATRFGGKHIFGLGIFLTSVLTLLTPLVAGLFNSIGPLVALRVVEGICEGVTFPAMFAMLGKWAPPLERSRMTTLCLSGSFVGNVISFPLTGYLCSCGFAGGWPSVFYTFGLAGVVWYVFWLFLAFETPGSHPRISFKELNYIQSTIPPTSRAKVISTPWLSILTSWPVWAIIVAHFCTNWGYYTLLTCLPTYLKDTQKGVDIGSNGILSGIPFLCQAVLAVVWGQVTDFLRGRGLSTVLARKANQTLGMLLPALFLLINCFFGNNIVMFVVYLSLAIGSVGFAISGFNCNHLDIAPRYSGILMGITNSIATIPGIVGPFVAKMIANADISETEVLKTQWTEVFIISAEVYVFGMIVYAVAAEGSRQPWARYEDSDEILVQNKVPESHVGRESPSVPKTLQKSMLKPKKQVVNM